MTGVIKVRAVQFDSHAHFEVFLDGANIGHITVRAADWEKVAAFTVRGGGSYESGGLTSQPDAVPPR
jgi:hypothetical protein